MASTINLSAIANALANAFGAITPPAGQDAVITKTYKLPENIVEFPTLLVFPHEPVTFGYDPGMREGELLWPVRLFISRQPLPELMDALYEWEEAMLAQYPVSSSIDLGLGSYVRSATVSAIGMTPFFRYGQPVADAPEYPVIEAAVTTLVGEPLS